MSKQLSPNGSETLFFEDMIISRMNGIRQGFRIDSVSPGINLIHGPNGIGKSRTALALQSLLWPTISNQGTSLTGNVRVSGDRWNIELELGKATWQKNSTPMTSFSHGIPPDSHRNRYLLTLQDLLRVDNRDFALEIQKEASGGYDLSLVRSPLNIPDRKRNFRPSQSPRQLQEVRENLQKLRRREAELLGQEKALDQIKADHAKAIAASNRLGELRDAQAFQDACSNLNASKIALDTFPKPLSKLMGDEYQRAESLIQTLEELRKEHGRESIRTTTLQEEMRSTGFNDTVPPTSVISSLRQHLGEVQRLDGELRQAESKIGELEGVLALLRDRLRRGLTEEQMETLDESGLHDLAALGRDWQLAKHTADTEAEIERWLGTSSTLNRESLRRGIDLLTRYLATPNTDAGNSRNRMTTIVLIGAAILLLVEAALLVASWSQFALVFTLAALPLLWLAFTSKADNSEAERKTIQAQYSTLGLTEPTSWSADDVHQALNAVQESAAQAELDHERELRWADLQDNRTRAKLQLQAVDDKRQHFIQTYGIELVDALPQSLEHIAKTLEEWRQATQQLSSANGRKQVLESTQRSTLAVIQKELQSHGLNAVVQDAIDANTSIEDLTERIEKARNALSSLEHIQRRIEKELGPQISRNEEQLASLYADLDLELHDLRGLKELTGMMKSYRTAQETYNSAKTAVTIARARLRDGSGDEDLDHEAIAFAVAKETELANRRDELQAEISRVTTEIDQARRQTFIEDQIAKEQLALENLAEGRQQDYTSAANRLVFEFVQNRNREVNRPPVFRTANDLFTSFTNGAYSLGLDEENSEFTAIEADTGGAVPLDRLSSGTRVQLLLAIRLAFIKASEQGVQLPLILDETLGNTDDARARAIIDATIEVARTGRQIFYFTAQQDEIGKWTSALSELDPPLDWEAHNLASIRGKATVELTTDFTWDHSTFKRLEISDDDDRASVYDLLDRPTFDVLTANVVEIDLWYFISEVPDLVELRNRGVHRWGQYLNLHSGGHLEGIWNSSLHERATVRARAIEEFLEAWRVGRPMPFTADDLKESNQISGSFWDRVIECAQKHKWDAAALIEALDRGEVSRFRRETTEQLSDWFRDHGFITDVEPLDDAIIRARVISSVNDAVQSDIIQLEDIDQLLSETVRCLIPSWPSGSQMLRQQRFSETTIENTRRGPDSDRVW